MGWFNFVNMIVMVWFRNPKPNPVNSKCDLIELKNLTYVSYVCSNPNLYISKRGFLLYVCCTLNPFIVYILKRGL